MDKIYNFKEELQKYNLTFETYEACVQDIIDKVNAGGEAELDWGDIIEKYNIPMAKDTMRKSSSSKPFGAVFIHEYFKDKEKIFSEDDAEKEQKAYRNETSINKDGSIMSNRLILINEDDLKNSNSLLSAHGFDVRDWELISARSNVWNVYSKKDGVKELYSSKIVVKPRTFISLEEIKEFYVDLLSTYSSPTVNKIEIPQTDKMLEIPIMDLHLGKLSSSDIVKEEYNSEIARECFNYIIDSVIERCKGMKFEKILFPVGNDFFNFDCVGSTTTGGTPQDNDRKHQTLFKDGVIMLIDGINKLSKEFQSPIDVFCVQGNHDFMTSYHAVMSLWCYFNNNENVTVDLDTSPRKYREFGNNLIGFSHGDKEKKRISGLMQMETPKLWGQTKYREWHLGHYHSESVKESDGVIVKHMPSVTGSDAWHHNSGFIGAVRKCTCYIWDKEIGVDTTFNVVIK
mgnify:CR=1 FL=1